MSSALAVFVTHDEAKIFKFNPEGVCTNHLLKEGSVHPDDKSQTDRFIKSVADFLIKSDSDQWLIVGPGLAKTHLQHLIETHYPNAKQKVVGVAPLDKSTNAEVIAFAHAYFKRRNLFVT